MTEQQSFTVSGWTGGQSGLGFKMSKANRNSYFPKNIKKITIHLSKSNKTISVDLSNKHGFWNKCPELANVETKAWLLQNGYERGGKLWKHGYPPKFTLTKIKSDEKSSDFKLSKKSD